MSYDVYTHHLRQFRIDLRNRGDLAGIGAVWAMNYAPGDPAQWVFPIGAAIDAYVFFGETKVFPQYRRQTGTLGVDEIEYFPMGTFLEGCDALGLVIRPLDHFGAEPLVEVAIEAPAEVNVTALRCVSPFTGEDGDGVEELLLATTPAKAYALPFRIDGPLLRAVTAAMNAPAAASASLEATMQITYTRDGKAGATLPFAVTLVQ